MEVDPQAYAAALCWFGTVVNAQVPGEWPLPLQPSPAANIGPLNAAPSFPPPPKRQRVASEAAALPSWSGATLGPPPRPPPPAPHPASIQPPPAFSVTIPGARPAPPTPSYPPLHQTPSRYGDGLARAGVQQGGTWRGLPAASGGAPGMAAHVGLSPALTFSSSAVSSDQLMHSHYQQERPQLRLPPSPSLHPAMAPAAVAPTMELRPQPCHQAHPTPRPLQAAFSATAGDLPRHMQAAAQLATAASTPASRRKRELLQSALFGEDSGTDGGGGDDGGRQQQQPLPYSRPAAAAKPQGPRRLMQSAAAAAPSRWPWLAAQRTDASGRPPGHPEYDPTTLHIPPDALKAMSNFERQFWDIKRRCMDLVLFVRHGAFYNAFDVDADVGLRVGLKISGPRTANMWKVGCHKDVFPVWAARVLQLGYCVGRVEEVAHGTAGSSTCKILQRKLVRIYTPGSAAALLELQPGSGGGSGATAVAGGGNDANSAAAAAAAAALEDAAASGTMRPLMAIVECTGGIDGANGRAGSGPPALLRRLGVCIIDLSLGTLQLGECEDASGTRTSLGLLLTEHDPSEIVSGRGCLSAGTLGAVKRHASVIGGAAPSLAAAGGGDAAAMLGAGSGGGGGDGAHVTYMQLPARDFDARVLHQPSEAWARLAALMTSPQCYPPPRSSSSSRPAVLFTRSGRLDVSSGSGSGPLAVADLTRALQPFQHQPLALAALAAAAAHLRRCQSLDLLAAILANAGTGCTVVPLKLATAAATAAAPPPPSSAARASLLAAAAAAAAAAEAEGAAALRAARPAASPHQQRHMVLDDRAVVTLELLQDSIGGTAGSLMGLLDGTASPAGRRTLRRWLCRPLAVASEIQERLSVVDTLMAHPDAAMHMQSTLASAPDCQKLLPVAARMLSPLQLLQQQQQSTGATRPDAGAAAGVAPGHLQPSPAPAAGACQGAAGRQRQWQQHAAGGGGGGGGAPSSSFGSPTVSVDDYSLAGVAATAEDDVDPSAVWAVDSGSAGWRSVGQLLGGLATHVTAVGQLRQHLSAAGVVPAKLPLLQRATLCAAKVARHLDYLAAAFRTTTAANHDHDDDGYDDADGLRPDADYGGPDDNEPNGVKLPAGRKGKGRGGGKGGRKGAAAGGAATTAHRRSRAAAAEAAAALQLDPLPGLDPKYDEAVAQAAAARDAVCAHLQALEAALLRAGANELDVAAWLPDADRVAALVAASDVDASGGGYYESSVGGDSRVSGASLVLQLPPGCAAAVQAAGFYVTGLTAAAGVSFEAPALLSQAAAQLQASLQAREEALALLVAAAAMRFMSCYSLFHHLTDATAALDVLAGFAATTHPSRAPPGCTYSRPVFVDAAPTAATAATPSSSSLRSVSSGSDGAAAPVLRLQGLWQPLLSAVAAAAAATAAVGRSAGNGGFAGARSGSVVCNDLQLGGTTAGAAGGLALPLPSADADECEGLLPGPVDCDVARQQQVPPVLLLTGPNMGGKSTLLRATCQAVIMGQVGAYVPAAAAHISPVDRIFTRIGAHDRIMSGESTFAVEMTEAASCLQAVTHSSLVVLDELGRGTATFDGYAIAFAVLRRLAGTVRCRTLFATHYHGLCSEAELSAAVQNGHMAVDVDAASGSFRPLYQLTPGPAPYGSCGILVASYAGVPSALLRRAQQQADLLASRTHAALLGGAPCGGASIGGDHSATTTEAAAAAAAAAAQANGDYISCGVGGEAHLTEEEWELLRAVAAGLQQAVAPPAMPSPPQAQGDSSRSAPSLDVDAGLNVLWQAWSWMQQQQQ